MSYGIKKLTLVAVILVVMPSIVFSSASKAAQLAVKGIKTLTVNAAQDRAIAKQIAQYVAQAQATPIHPVKPIDPIVVSGYASPSFDIVPWVAPEIKPFNDLFVLNTVFAQDIIKINPVAVALVASVVAGAASSLYYASKVTTESVENAILL